MPLDLPMFAADFEPSSLASLPSKTLSNDFIVDTILVRGGYWLYTIVQSIIKFTRSRGTLEHLARFPLVPLPPSSYV